MSTRKPQTPALNLAIDYLRTAVKNSGIRKGEKLPTVRELAQIIGVSVPTVCKALASVRASLDLSIGPRRGITIGAPRFAALRVRAPQPVRRARTEALLRDITRDILTGKFGSGPDLPMGKELKAAYGISYTTLRSMLDKLVRSGILCRHGKRYRRVPAPARRRGMQVLMIISEGAYRIVERWGLVRAWVLPMIRAMEQECVRRGLRLVVRPFAESASILQGLTECIGALVYLEPEYPRAEKSNLLIRSLLSGGYPVFVVSQNYPERFGSLPRSKNLMFVTNTVPAAAIEIGRYLLGLGHRKVCFFSNTPDNIWFEERRTGLAQAFAEAGIDDGVITLYGELPGGRAAPERAGILPLSRKDQRQYLLGEMRRVRGRFPDGEFKERLIGNLQEMLDQASELWDRLAPEYEKALAIPGATAWIAADDQMAVHSMLPFLDSRRIKVPDRLSVIGFGNWPEATSRLLTTIDLANTPTMATTALELLLYPERRKNLVDPQTDSVTIEPVLVDRGSVGPARAQ